MTHVGEPDLPLCRDCAFARPSPSRRAIAPLGVTQWESSKCYHPAAIQDEDTADLRAARLTGGKGRKALAKTSQCYCSTMRRFEHLCGTEGVYFTPRMNRLPPPMTVVGGVVGGVIWPVMTGFSVFSVVFGALYGFGAALLVRRSD